MIDRRLLRGLFFVGRIFSPLYSLAMRLRAVLYARGGLASTRLPLPVISVGNLTMGGTGKTPMVIYVARLLAKAGRRPAVLSRGYGGRSRQPVNLVATGQEILLPPDQAGDEPVLLAQSLPGVPVVTARRRALGGKYLADRGLADVVILDDGFQHLAVQRDLDLVLFAADKPLDAEWVFPGGQLREPVSALSRADCFVVTGGAEAAAADRPSLSEWLRQAYPGTPLFAGRYKPVALYTHEGEHLLAADVAKVPLFAFCGLANPGSFRQTLGEGFWIKGWQAFTDHHPFTAADLADLAHRANEAGCKALITTEKDFVKIKALAVSLPIPIWVLAVELRMAEGFDRFVLERVGARGNAGQRCVHMGSES